MVRLNQSLFVKMPRSCPSTREDAGDAVTDFANGHRKPCILMMCK